MSPLGLMLRLSAVVVPVLLIARPLGDPADALRGFVPPEAHSVDLEGRHTEGLDFDVVAAKQASRDQLNAGFSASALTNGAGLPPTGIVAAQAVAAPASQLGGFTLIGSVAVLGAEESMVTRQDTGWGITPVANLAAITSRFIQVFGDDYDQIAVFLSFVDRLSPQALAYLQPVKNDVRGLGMGLFDRTDTFGSKGRMQAVLNMKRINLYGRDAAGDPDNGLYPVWAQEAAHRWLVYFQFKRADETMLNASLLGRQNAHWARGVEAQGSIMDGYDWKENSDGTFTPGKRGFRYGRLDQYGMGLIPADQVPPFYLLEDLRDSTGTPVPESARLSAAGRYQAKKVQLTVQDIIRGVGAREPAVDVAAQDLRMGVILLAVPGEDLGRLVGEAFQIDNTRRLWTEFYNTAGEGRGKVCTNLLRPCRGEAFTFGNINLDEGPKPADPDGVVARGEPFTLQVEITNSGDQPARPDVSAQAAGLIFNPPSAAAPLMPGQTTTVTLSGRVRGDAACGQLTTIDLSIAGARGRSRELRDTVIGLRPHKVETFEGAAVPAGWRLDPDGGDAGQAGRWAWGGPERSVAFDYTLQPGAPYSGERAFVTGLSTMEIDNVEGRTTLESAPFSLTGVREPTLSYQVYFVAADFVQEVLVPAPSGVLRVLASIDAKTFVEVDRLTGMATGWQRRVVRLADKLGDGVRTAADVRLRFVAEENSQSMPSVVEASIDEVGIFDEAPSCATLIPETGGGNPDPGGGAGGDDGGGCACAIGAVRPRSTTAAGTFALALGAVALARGLSRRRRQAHGRTPRSER